MPLNVGPLDTVDEQPSKPTWSVKLISAVLAAIAFVVAFGTWLVTK